MAASVFFLLVAVSFSLSLALTLVMHLVSPRLGLVDHPGERKIHRVTMPTGGGVAIMIATWLPVWAGVLACMVWKGAGLAPALWAEFGSHASGVVALAPRLGIIFAGAAIIWLIGLADDVWDLPAWPRFLVQVGVALMLYFSGLNVSIFIPDPWVSGAITVLWIVGLVNSFNMLDNMDGLSAGVACIIGATLALVAYQTGHLFVTAFLCCVVGAVAGFLVFNFPPATIFMGDCGGTLIGYLLAVMTVEFTFYQPERPYFPIALPLIMFAVPLFDTITVVWIRLRAGRSPWKGDTNHFSHRLVALGMSQRQAVLTIYLITATVELGAGVLYYSSSAAILVILAQTVALFAIIGILENARPEKARR